MKIRTIDFDFDILRAADADRFQQAVDALQAAAAAVPPSSGFGDIIRANCAMIDDFLARILGENYDALLAVPADDLRALQGLYREVLAEIGRAQEELKASFSSDPAAVTARTDLQVQARQAAQTAARSLPAPAPKTLPADFSHMNRAQRRAYVQALAGRKG